MDAQRIGPIERGISKRVIRAAAKAGRKFTGILPSPQVGWITTPDGLRFPHFYFAAQTNTPPAATNPPAAPTQPTTPPPPPKPPITAAIKSWSLQHKKAVWGIAIVLAAAYPGLVTSSLFLIAAYLLCREPQPAAAKKPTPPRKEKVKAPPLLRVIDRANLGHTILLIPVSVGTFYAVVAALQQSYAAIPIFAVAVFAALALRHFLMSQLIKENIAKWQKYLTTPEAKDDYAQYLFQHPRARASYCSPECAGSVIVLVIGWRSLSLANTFPSDRAIRELHDAMSRIRSRENGALIQTETYHRLEAALKTLEAAKPKPPATLTASKAVALFTIDNVRGHLDAVLSAMGKIQSGEVKLDSGQVIEVAQKLQDILDARAEEGDEGDRFSPEAIDFAQHLQGLLNKEEA